MKLFLPLVFLFFSLDVFSQKLITPPNANKKEVKILKEILKKQIRD